jgi:hypothetical protein
MLPSALEHSHRQKKAQSIVKLDFYLSEMSVSDQHGGGLTLQNILGDDLDSICCFLHVHRFAQWCPPTERLRERCLEMPMWVERHLVRRCLRSTTAEDWLAGRQWILRQHARLTARRIYRNFGWPRQLCGLVCPQGERSLRVLEHLKRLTKVNYVTWMMDDHLLRFQEGRWQYPGNLRETMRKHLWDARAVFSISAALAEFYKKEFGVTSEVLVAPAEYGCEPVWLSPSPGAGCRLGYFGRLHAWQLDALNRLVPLLQPADCSLDIFCPDEDARDTLVARGVCLRGWLPRENVVAQMRTCDAVVLPISFAERDRNLCEFNVATKLSELLASGTVILAVGPEYAAMTKLLQSAGAAQIVTNPEVPELARAAFCIKETTHRRNLLVAAGELLRRDFSCVTMRDRWRSGLKALNN